MKTRHRLPRLCLARRWWVLVFVLLATPCRSQPKTAQAAFRGLTEVDSMLAVEAYSAAVEKAGSLVGRYGTDPIYGWQLKGRLGLARVRSGDAAGAVVPLTEAIMTHPQDPVLHRNLAFALKVLGRKGRALAEYETVVQMAPADFAARLEYGQTLLEFKDFRGAERELRLASGLCHQCLDADQALANLYLARGDRAAAVPYLRRLWLAEPSVQLRLLLATSLVSSGQGAQALSLLDSVPRVTLVPDEWRALVQAEKDAPQLGTRWSLVAVTELSRAAKTTSCLPAPLVQDPKFWALVAANLSQATKFAETLPALRQALTLEPDNATYHRNLAAALLALGRQEEARRQWDEVLRLDPRQNPTGGHTP